MEIPSLSFEHLIQIIESLSLEECPTILEIGAHHGYFTEIMSNNSPSGRILAVEADERSLATLYENVGRCANVEIINALVGSQNKVVNFNLANANAGINSSPSTLSNYLHSSVPGFDINYVQRSMTSCTLSKFCESRCPSLIELLVLDVTRYEIEILRSSTEILSRINRIMLRRYNITKVMAVEGSPLLSDYVKLLEPYGFTLECLVHRQKFYVFKQSVEGISLRSGFSKLGQT